MDIPLLPSAFAGYLPTVDLDAAVAALAPRLVAYATGRTGCRSTGEDVAQDALTALVVRWKRHGPPPLVSLALDEVAVPDVFRAIGAAVGVAVVIEGRVERPPVTVKFTNAPTSAVLDSLCKNAGCTWEYDNGSRQLRVRFQAP